MAWQSAPTTTANNSNQNWAQEFSGFFVGPTQPIPTTMQAAPSPVAINANTPKGYPIG